MTQKAGVWGAGVRRPLWFELLVSALTTGIMSGAVSGVATARSLGWAGVVSSPPQWLADWGKAFVLAWPVAFLLFWFVAPRLRRALEHMVGERGNG